MHDRVAEVLRQREALDRGPGTGIALSFLLHGGLVAFGVYAALHSPPPRPAAMVNIRLASPAYAQPAQPLNAAPKPAAPPEPAKIEEPKPKIEEPKPAPVQPEPPKPLEKNTVPLSPFGRSTKKGSEAPVPTPAPAPANTGTVAGTGTAAIPIGESGVGFEGGDFKDALYIQAMHRQIGGRWARMAAYDGPPAIIYFRILRNGTVTEAKVATSSGNPTFDRAALSAVRSASPLNQLPMSHNGTYLGVYLVFK